MKTLQQLEQERATAGAAWLSALDALRAAYVELAALDMAVCNGGCSRTFNAQLSHPEHPDFMSSPWPDQGQQVRNRSDAVRK